MEDSKVALQQVHEPSFQTVMQDTHDDVPQPSERAMLNEEADCDDTVPQTPSDDVTDRVKQEVDDRQGKAAICKAGTSAKKQRRPLSSW